MKNKATAKEWHKALEEGLEEMKVSKWGDNHLLIEAIVELISIGRNLLNVRGGTTIATQEEFASMTEYFRQQGEGALRSMSLFLKIVPGGGPKLTYSVYFEWHTAWFGFLSAVYREVEN